MAKFPLLSHNTVCINNEFWGEITSTIDWCEINYRISVYICEFFNTLSSLCIILVAIGSYVLHRRIMTLSFQISHVLLVTVGIGSVAFHMSLKHHAQMMDELPMLWFVLSILYIILRRRSKHLVLLYNTLAALLITCYGILSTVLIITATSQELQVFWFHLTFISTGFVSVLVYLCQWWWCSTTNVKTNIYNNKLPNHNILLSPYSCKTLMLREKTIVTGVSCGLGAILCWLIDTHFCELMQKLPLNPQLHAWWHILIAIGVYCLMTLVFLRATAPSSKMLLLNRCIPYVALRTKKHYLSSSV